MIKFVEKAIKINNKIKHEHKFWYVHSRIKSNKLKERILFDNLFLFRIWKGEFTYYCLSFDNSSPIFDVWG